MTTAVDIHAHLRDLYVELALAGLTGLDRDPDYMADLEDEIAVSRAAFTAAAVTEIASLRGALEGRLRG